jgi:hypothetical protein
VRDRRAVQEVCEDCEECEKKRRVVKREPSLAG